jgi:hypothetical protein
LHEENERLHQINQWHEMKLSVRGYVIQVDGLKAANAELLTVLKWLKNFLGGKHMPECVSRIHDAIAKAEGGK